MQSTKAPVRRVRHLLASAACTALVVGGAAALLWGCSPSMFMQSPWDAIPQATPEEIARLHQPEALRADLDAIVALHERTCPNPYLRVSKESILELAERLKASIDRPMTRREFLPIVMEMQAGYRSDHYGQGVPSEDLAAAFARGERLLPFRAEPKDDALVVVAVAEAERAIEPGDTIVRIGGVSAADHLVRLRALVPAETARYRDVSVRERFRTLSWSAGITLPTEVEDTGSSSAKPAAQTREEEKQSTDLEQIAPLDLQASVFGPKATVYRGELTFRVRLRDGAAKPAEGASNP